MFIDYVNEFYEMSAVKEFHEEYPDYHVSARWKSSGESIEFKMDKDDGDIFSCRIITPHELIQLRFPFEEFVGDYILPDLKGIIDRAEVEIAKAVESAVKEQFKKGVYPCQLEMNENELIVLSLTSPQIPTSPKGMLSDPWITNQ